MCAFGLIISDKLWKDYISWVVKPSKCWMWQLYWPLAEKAGGDGLHRGRGTQCSCRFFNLVNFIMVHISYTWS